MLISLHPASAQNSIYNKGVVWKKNVTREIEIRNKNTAHLKNISKDTSLAQMMISDALQGKISAWSTIDHNFTTRLMVNDLISLLGISPDTTVARDYQTGNLTTNVRVKDFDYDSVYKYRILEEWTFNPYTGATDIHIAGIAPVRNFYVNYDFRGVQAMFWLKYADMTGILERYDKKHPDNTFTMRLRNDYFSDSEQNNDNLFKTRVARLFDLSDKKEMEAHHLKDLNTDTTILTLIGIPVAGGRIKAYDESGAQINKDGYGGIPDTTIVVDPITGQEMQKIIKHDLVITFFHTIKVIEEWTINKTGSDIHIQITNIVPFAPGSTINGNVYRSWDLCWLRYNDVKDIIASYEQTHPTDNLATRIWNDYFYGDVKPKRIK